MINAFSRYELLTANQLLIDFHFNRVLQNKKKKHKSVNDTITEQVVEESASKVSVVGEKTDVEKQKNV